MFMRGDTANVVASLEKDLRATQNPDVELRICMPAGIIAIAHACAV